MFYAQKVGSRTHDLLAYLSVRQQAQATAAPVSPPVFQLHQLHKRMPTFAGHSCHQSWRSRGSKRSTQVPVCPCGVPLFLMASSPSLLSPLHIHLSFLGAAGFGLQHLSKDLPPKKSYEDSLNISYDYTLSGPYINHLLICISPQHFCFSV